MNGSVDSPPVLPIERSIAGDTTYVIEMKGITKEFPGARALDRVDFRAKRGEVHALVGENGAGKSTLIKIMAGIYHPDAGEVLVEGHRVQIRNPHHASRLGLSFIHQELNLIPFFNAIENIHLGLPMPRTRIGLIDWRRLRNQAAEVVGTLGISLDIREPVSRLSVAQQRVVMICRALMLEARLVVMDEPTASLTEEEVEALFRVIAKLKERGVTVIYVSHRLEEVFRVADSVTVMKDARVVGTLPKAGLTSRQLVTMIAGKELESIFPERKTARTDTKLLTVRGLSGGIVRDVGFDLHAGEILGLAGLVGAGRTELVRMLFGADKRETGEILLNERPTKICNPQDAIRAGITLLPEDRRGQGGV